MDSGDRLQALRDRFRARLAEELAAFEALADDLDDPASFAAIEERAHKLAGLAGSLGFADVSSAAGDLDHPQDRLACDLGETEANLLRIIAVLRGEV